MDSWEGMGLAKWPFEINMSLFLVYVATMKNGGQKNLKNEHVVYEWPLVHYSKAELVVIKSMVPERSGSINSVKIQ